MPIRARPSFPLALVAGVALAVSLVAGRARAEEIDPPGRRVYDAAAPRVVVVKGPTQLGAGMVVDRRGLILTCQHVIRAQPGVQVKFWRDRAAEGDGGWHAATVVAEDERRDLALLSAADPPADLTELVFGDSSRLFVPQVVYAVGHPLGKSRWNLAATFVSSLIVDFPDTFAIDRKLEHGYSGGPLLSERGEVVGVNSFVLAEARSTSYARSGNSAREFVADYLRGLNQRLGKPRRNGEGFEIQAPAGWAEGTTGRVEVAEAGRQVLFAHYDHTVTPPVSTLTVEAARKKADDPVGLVADVEQEFFIARLPGSRVEVRDDFVLRGRSAVALLGGYDGPEGQGRRKFLRVIIDLGDRAHVIAYEAPAAVFDDLYNVFQDSVYSYRWPQGSLDFATPRGAVDCLVRYAVEGDREAWLSCWDVDAAVRQAAKEENIGAWSAEVWEQRRRLARDALLTTAFEPNREAARRGAFRIGAVVTTKEEESAWAEVFRADSDQEETPIRFDLVQGKQGWRVVNAAEGRRAKRQEFRTDKPERTFESLLAALAAHNTEGAVACFHLPGVAARRLTARGEPATPEAVAKEESPAGQDLRATLLPRVAALLPSRLEPLAPGGKGEAAGDETRLRYAVGAPGGEQGAPAGDGRGPAMEVCFARVDGSWKIVEVRFP
ncbi:MAG: trypsin-like peptidase domain-containing protein [Planctomycetes bacterium]|nr:trypsin-like peptidase domain-containing protein [Planctomycetota bacterium]